MGRGNYATSPTRPTRTRQRGSKRAKQKNKTGGRKEDKPTTGEGGGTDTQRKRRATKKLTKTTQNIGATLATKK